MGTPSTPVSAGVCALTARITAAYVSNNFLANGDLPVLLHSVHGALQRLKRGQDGASPEMAGAKRLLPVAKTITPDHLISLEDGRPYKVLTRHLASRGLSPGAYRRKWDLPSDYPMVAPSYSAHRRFLAKQIGLRSQPASRNHGGDATGAPSAQTGLPGA